MSPVDREDVPPDAATQQLHAYADGRLSPEETRRVEARLAADPAAAALVAEWRHINAGLHALYDPALDEAVPRRLLVLGPPRWRGWVAQAAAAALLLALGGAGGWFGHQLAEGEGTTRSAHAFAERAAMAHAVYVPEVRHPVEVAADQEAHLVAWLSKRLGAKLKAPKLTKQGYELVGGRLLPGNDGPAAQFMYQDASGQRVTLYLKHLVEGVAHESQFRYEQAGKICVFTWIDDRVAYALAAEMPREQHLALAEVIYRQLNP